MESQQELKQRISELETELVGLREAANRSGYIKRANLPPCESQLCWNCKHAVTVQTAEYMQRVLLGCGKQIKCKDYEPIQTTHIVLTDWTETKRSSIAANLTRRYG